MHQFKAKDSEIKPYPLCLGNILKDFTIDNMKKTGFKGYVHFFSVDYNFIDTKDFFGYSLIFNENNIMQNNIWIHYKNVYWIINGLHNSNYIIEVLA